MPRTVRIPCRSLRKRAASRRAEHAELVAELRLVEAFPAQVGTYERKKPDRRLDTNVEVYTALLLHGLGLEAALLTPMFAVGRVTGWAAHALEQIRNGRLIRPESRYAGPRGRRYTPLDLR